MILINFLIAVGFLVGGIYFHKNKITLLEGALQLVIPIGIGALFFFIYRTGKSTDHEYWGNNVEYIYRTTEYNSYDYNSCCTEYSCNCDDEGKCDTCCDSCYECNRTSAKFYAVLNTGSKRSISNVTYYEIKKRFNTEEINKGVWKTGNKGGGCGETRSWKYTVHWDKSWKTAWNYSSKHRYTNKVVLSSTLYTPRKISQEEKEYYNLLDYPVINRTEQQCLIGITNREVEQRLQYFNGKYGKDLQIRLFIWNLDSPIGAAEMQKHYIQNGNKNEVNIILNKDEYAIGTWCNEAEFTVRLENMLQEGNIDLLDFVYDFEKLAKEHYVRREFTPLNAVVNIPVPLNVRIWSIFLHLIISSGLLYYFIVNEFQNYNYV